MTVDRVRGKAGRVGGFTAALGVGAVIALGAAGPAWAADEGTSAESPSDSSQTDDAPKPARDNDSESTPAAPASGTEDPADPAETGGTGDTGGTGEPRDDAEPEDGSDVSDADLAEDPTDAQADPDETLDDADADAHAHAEAPDSRDTATVDIVDTTTGTTTPDAPAAVPALWSLAGAARREDDDRTHEQSTAPTTAGTLPASEIAVLAVPPATEPVYTGRPSFVHNLVTAGLNVLKVVLKPFGGLLSFTSLKIPFFTDGIPPFFFRAGLDVTRTEFEGMKVWSLTPRRNATDDVVVALHGGAYVATASIFHWWTYADMARDTGATVIVPLQTLVTKGGTAATEVPRTANFLTAVIDEHGAQNVSLFGDSAGGGLALAATQELVRRNATTPSRMVLLAPWLDVSMSDPRSAEVRDPLLDIPNLVRSGAKWAGAAGTSDPMASPLFGSLQGLPPTVVYSSSRDLLTVDTVRLRDRVLAEGIPNVTFQFRAGLIHDWFTFPFLPDAHEDRAGVYADLVGPSVVSTRASV
ncbi:acetyl esterase/lipase [Mycolicibacterium iranicum]|uniref:Acetyl esterase/lipase n=1 Tax=Mycolicibacterium iranicum TaxID=912594 RepID=A0A839Q610_MYCIR|nr:alpha/beta hydrolase fold domain-containing protein [Mycolicibacterium iranicum]MBB2991668.1 acetyl esterase/lipase [Mycolicibacterium iranicum]